MGRKKRAWDTGLFAERLVQTESYPEILKYVLKEQPCTIGEITVSFRNGYGGNSYSSVFRRVSRLEKAKTLSAKSDGVSNWYSITELGKRLLDKFA